MGMLLSGECRSEAAVRAEPAGCGPLNNFIEY